MLTLSDFLQGLGLAGNALASAVAVRGAAIDSRVVQPGDVFVARVGESLDGHRYLGQAFERGAVAALVSRDQDVVPTLDTRDPAAVYQGGPVAIRTDDADLALQRIAKRWRGLMPARVIGVTGSVGKTSTKELIAQVLSVRYRVLKTEGNLNTSQGVPMTLLRLRPEHQFAVVEMGMDRLGEIQSYCDWSTPQVGVITNVGPVHMEKLGSLANIAKAKAELVQALPADGVAVLNADDALVMEMRALTKARVMTYGLTAKADIWADEIEGHGLDGTSFTLHQGSMAQRVRVPLLGGHSAHTALRAACTGLAVGMSWGEIVEGLMKSPDEQLRLVVTKGPHGSIVLDDSYNASAESNLAALNLLKDINEGVRVAVLGDMFELGAAERQQHDEVGCRAGVVADFVVGVGKRAEWICAAAVECGLAKDHVFHVMTNAQAIDVLRGLITQKSAILVKGSRGMQMEEIVQGLEGLASA